MTYTHMRVCADAKEKAMEVISKFMDEGVECSVFREPCGDAWIVLGRVGGMKEREQRDLAQTLVDAHLGVPRLE